MIKQIVNIALMSLLLLSCKNNNQSSDFSSNEDLSSNSYIDTLNSKVIYGQDFFNSSLQTFKFVASKKVEFIGLKGTKIRLSSNLFGTYKGEVELNLVECYDAISMLNMNLSTYTLEGKPLETGGMIFVNFKDTLGQQLKPINHYSVHFSKNMDTRMKLFYSKRDNLVEPPKWEEDVYKSNNIKVKQEESIRYYDVTYEGDTIPVDYDQNELVKNLNSIGIFFDTKEVGWLNCDRFLSFNNTVAQMLQMDEEKKSLNYFILLKKYKTISLGHLNRDRNIKFNPIPKGENVVLVGVNFNDGKVDYTLNTLSISEEPFYDKQVVQRLSTKEFETKLKSLGINW